MSKTNKIVPTAMTKLGDTGAKAKKAWNQADLAKKAGALVSAGASVTLVGRPGSDNRTTALLATSVTALETLGVWKSCGQKGNPKMLNLRFTTLNIRNWLPFIFTNAPATKKARSI